MKLFRETSFLCVSDRSSQKEVGIVWSVRIGKVSTVFTSPLKDALEISEPFEKIRISTLAQLCFDAQKHQLVIPAHLWARTTVWFWLWYTACWRKVNVNIEVYWRSLAMHEFMIYLWDYSQQLIFFVVQRSSSWVVFFNIFTVPIIQNLLIIPFEKALQNQSYTTQQV